jgi:iron complex outermembrane receptor protein
MFDQQKTDGAPHVGVAAFFVCLLLAGPAYAQSASITVEVKDTVGAPIPGAVVTIAGPANRALETGADGRVSLDELAPGQYRVTAAARGFAPAERAVRLRAGDTTSLSLTLLVQSADYTRVTAARIGERDIQATPIAVSALSSADLQRTQAHTVEQLAGMVPSLTFSQNTGFSQVTIRGIGTNAVFAGSDPSSAVYVDGVYMARPAMVLSDFMELDRVEVLRGPQGTLYGRNAVGGAVNVVTRPPTNELEASARVDVGTADTLRAEARVSGPLVRDRVLGSVSFLRGVRQGFVNDLTHPDAPLGGEDVTAALGKLHVVFNRRTDLLVSGDFTYRDPIPLVYAKVLAVKPGFVVDNPPGLHDVRTSVPAWSESLQYGGAARLTVRLAPHTVLTSLTAFRKLDYELFVDGDITELDLTISNVHEIQHQVSEEVTVAHERPGLSWIGGVFLFNEHDRQPTFVHLGGARRLNHLDPDVEADSKALFGQVTIALASHVSATAGLRYTREGKQIDNRGQLFTLDLPRVPVANTAYAYTDAISHTAWTPKVGLEFQPTAATMAYVSAARGFKSGGFNLTSQAAGRGYAPELAWSYEGGLKTLLAGGRARLNVAAFQTDYEDLQVQTAILPGVIDISNAAAATIRGIELEGVSRLAHSLNAGGHLAWLDATYDEYIAVGAGGIIGDVAGRRLSNAPEWSGRLWLEWRTSLARSRTLSLRADTRWQSTVFFTPFNDDIQRQRPCGLLDLSAEFGVRHFTVGAYARNLTNEDYITGAFSSPQPAFGGRPGDSRQIGVQLSVRR